MMFSMEKCTDHSGRKSSEETEMYAGGGEGLGKEGVPSDEVASAVAAVSDEIGDILKDELGDADRVDRIGAELADLSAELGLLAGLADGDQQQDFPSLFEIAVNMGQRGSGSGSSSSSWSGRARRRERPQRAARRRPIARKEMCRRRSAMARRAASLRVRRVEVVSDASDVGADSDSDDQWTELDDSGSSDSSSLKEAAGQGLDCNGFQDQGPGDAEAPTMGQFLLPLLSADPADHPPIRHEDILQLLASAEETVRDELPIDEDSAELDEPCEDSEAPESEEAPVTPEEEAALLHYVCEAERSSCPPGSGQPARFTAVEEWLMGVYHSWCEISALLNTLDCVSDVSAGAVREEWGYLVQFGCHCPVCLTLANNAEAVCVLLGDVVWALALSHGGSSVTTAVGIVRALRLRADAGAAPQRWDLPRLRRTRVPDHDLEIIHQQLTQLSQQNEISARIVNDVCLCRKFDKPLQKEYAFERFCQILENFKAASTMTFKVDMVDAAGAPMPWASRARGLVSRQLRPHQRCPTAARLQHMARRTAAHDAILNAWSGYKHRCDCLTPRTLCAQQRKQLLRLFCSRISFFGIMQAVNEFNGGKDSHHPDKAPNEVQPEAEGRQLQQGDGTGAKPPDSGEPASLELEHVDPDHSDSNVTGDLDDLTESDGSGSGSLGLSTSSSLDSASELLLAAAAAVDSGDERGGGGRGLCRTVRHLCRSIASIERLMDRVLKHCDDWPAIDKSDNEARKRVDMGLSEVDRKLMAMYRRLPEVHRRQLQVYRKQKRLSTVCMQLVGGRAPAPPPPGSPPPAAHQPCVALCVEYHLQRFTEVRRKVMHMRDQQLYYHRLRMWLEQQLRQERGNLPDSNVTLIEEIPRRKRRTASPKVPRLTTAAKRKLKPSSPLSKPHKILQMLKEKAPSQSELEELKNEENKEADPPEAFPLEREDNISDTETIVGEKDQELCKDMKECLAKFANFALNSEENSEVKYPESVSPPLQEMSPTTSEPLPVYTPKPSQRLLTVNKFLNRSDFKTDNVIDFQSQATPDIHFPIDARRTPVLVKEESEIKIEEPGENVEAKDPNIYKYVTFGLEIKKAMEECQNIINSYNNISKDSKEKDDGALSLEQICEVMMSLDKNSAEFLEKIDSDEPIDINVANTKLAEFVENMPQILANMPEIATKLTEFANASFELPEFASIMNSLPDVNNEAQLTPETLKQIRELKLHKNRDSIKVTKNTAKRKCNRKIKNDDVIGPFEIDSQDISELLKDEKELQNMMKKSNNKEDFNDLLFSISAQVVINKVFEYLKQNKSPVLAKCLQEDGDIFALPKNSINSEMYSKASTLFDNSVKDALSMDQLRDLVRSRFDSWKHYVATKFKSIPIELLESEIEAMLDKFYSYIQDLASKQSSNESDKIIEKIDELRNNKDFKDSDSDSTSKESLQHITKLLSSSAGNTFDLLIMKLSKMSQDKKSSVKNLKFKYIDVIKRCSESQQLVGWILLDPEIASNVISELTGLPMIKTENLPYKVPDFTTLSHERKKDYFISKLRQMNRLYMQTLPKKALTGDEWLVMLYRLEQLEEKLKDGFAKVTPPTKNQNASEGEILAAKGLSKIIGKANVRVVKKPEAKPVKKEEKPETTQDQDKKTKNDALLAKCEAILTSKGEKSLLDSFYTIKSYITQGLPVPETYKKHVISICSSIDAKLLDEDIEETLKVEDAQSKEKLSVIGSQNPELLAKYSAQALRNAKQTLNAVAFKNMAKNGQSKSESDACDIPKSDCKWTNDCVCSSCKGPCKNFVKGYLHMEGYLKDKDGKARPAAKPVKPPPKACENTQHQQHVCKVGHANNTSGCASEGTADSPCTCCYCTVFGHAPPLTTPVPRNFNETRERLRSILNKKKQQCKTANGEPEQDKKPPSQAQAEPVKPKLPPQLSPKPALPKTLPPSLPPAQQQKRQSIDLQQKQLADKMAKMTVNDKAKTLQSSTPVQVSVPPTKPEIKPNNSAEQMRLQQLQQQRAQQQLQQQQQQQNAPQQQPSQQQQKKPEPIYDLPVHNKPTLTPQQQQQIRQQQLLHQQQHQQQLQQQQAKQAQAAAQQQAQQRQSRQQQQMSVSSRDSSVYSTSSGCSGGSCWRGSRPTDPRDLDALLQYIEGPARHVDRGKKRAKKLRQRAKRMETRLLEERQTILSELTLARGSAAALQSAAADWKRRLEEARQQHSQHQARKKKGKKQKLNPAQQATMQAVAEQIGELTTLMNSTAKEAKAAEQKVATWTRRLQECDRQLAEAQALQEPQQKQAEQAALAAKQQQQQLLQQQQLQQQQLQQQQMQLKQLQQQQLQQQQLQQQQLQQQRRQMQLLEQQREKQKQAPADNMVMVRRGPQGVTVCVPAGHDQALNVAAARRHFQVVTHEELQQQKQQQLQQQQLQQQQLQQQQLQQQQLQQQAAKQAERKQTWEQALAHINQLAKGNKEKKKQKEQQRAEQKQKEQKNAPAPEPEPQPLSKKQRRLLAKQQAEEEERKRRELEAKSKKEVKKQEPKAEVNKKQDKKEAKNEPPKEDKKKKEKEEKKKGKENKEKTVTTQPPKQSTQQQTQQQQQQQQQQNSKKEKKKKKEKSQQPQVINITPDTTIEIVDKKNQCNNGELEKQSPCSIMEQLSCGVQVADLRLPPGITLTRVQPSDKRDPPNIKSVPLWKCSQLPATPTPVARPAPVINADPSMMMFSATHPEPPKPAMIPEPVAPPAGKSKKAKKKAKKAAAAETAEPKQDAKMVTLRNPMFHPNLPPVQISNAPAQKKSEIRIPDPIPMPPNACQATITPTSNGMYTIRNPLMSIMHQQSVMGMRNPSNPMFTQPQYNYVNPNYPIQTPYMESRTSPKDDFQNRIMNLASFTQKNDEGYSLFKTSDDNQQRSFLAPEYYDRQSPKPVVSPNPIGTRPNSDRSNDSLFANPIQRPEPIGTPLKQDNDFSGGLYTPFGQENRNVFRNALFNDKNDMGSNSGKMDDMGAHHIANGDPLPYFQRLRVGSKLNNEVTIHHVTESKFYKGQDTTESTYGGAWPDALYAQRPIDTAPVGAAADEEVGFGAVGTGARHHVNAGY